MDYIIDAKSQSKEKDEALCNLHLLRHNVNYYS